MLALLETADSDVRAGVRQCVSRPVSLTVRLAYSAVVRPVHTEPR
jgi:hypothetical protein